MISSRLSMFVFSVIAASAYFEEKEKVAHPTNGALNDTQQGLYIEVHVKLKIFS